MTFAVVVESSFQGCELPSGTIVAEFSTIEEAAYFCRMAWHLRSLRWCTLKIAERQGLPRWMTAAA